MASDSKSHVNCFALLSYLILVACLTHACLRASGSEFVITKPNSISAEKVMLDLYYETLCPFSAHFIGDHLSSIFVNRLIDIVNLQLIPWGNAIVHPNKTFECQHGAYECKLNTIHACTIAIQPSVNKHFPFIHCVEKLVYEGNHTRWDTCFNASALDPKPILGCYNSGYGTKLELKYAKVTDALRPPHQYVPWVVVNGIPLYEDYDNFTSYVCKAYKGSVPKPCKDVAINNAPRKAYHFHPHPVCYTEKSA